MPENGVFIPDNFWMGIKTGYEGDIVFSRSMIAHTSQGYVEHQISGFNSYFNGGTLTIDFANRLSVYGALGSYRLKLTQNLVSENSVHYSSDAHLAAILGAKVIAACWGETQLGFDVKGFLSYPNLQSILLNGESVAVNSAKCSDRQWQIGAALSQRVSWFVPYIGLTYTHARLKIAGLSSLESLIPQEEVRFNNKYSFGFVFGFGLGPNRGFDINLETRLIEETAVGLNADFRF